MSSCSSICVKELHDLKCDVDTYFLYCLSVFIVVIKPLEYVPVLTNVLTVESVYIFNNSIVCSKVGPEIYVTCCIYIYICICICIFSVIERYCEYWWLYSLELAALQYNFIIFYLLFPLYIVVRSIDLQ